MFSNISIGQLCGFLFLFILLTSALSQALAGVALDPTDFPGTMGKVSANSKKFRLSVVIDLISHASIFALAGLLFIAFSPYGRALALIGTLWRVVEGTILVLNETNNILLLAVVQKFVSATGEDAGELESLGSTIILAEDWGMKIAMAFLALGALSYAILFVTSGTVPLALGWFGVIAALLAVVGRWLVLVSPAAPMVLQASFLPYILFEVVFGFWLLIWGGQVGQL